ncbi:MAG: PorV/PorQ family protein [Candidatus Kariarchaeaceae archaeon]|jgi:hypothetical protein
MMIWTTNDSSAQNRVAQSTMTFLSIDPVARSVGMGEASTCIDNDVNAIFNNPAGIAKISGGAISLNRTLWLAGMKLYSGAISYGHTTLGTFAASLVLMDNGDINRTVPDESERGFHLEDPFNVNQFSLGLGYGRQLTDKFSIGGQIKYAYQDLGSTDIIANPTTNDTLRDIENNEGLFALDFGTIYYVGFNDLRVAMSFRNFATSVKYSFENFQLPLVLRLAIAMNVLSIFSDLDDQSLLVTLSASNPNDFSERVNVGGEYNYKDFILLRAGYRFNYTEGNLSAGFGLTPTALGLNLKFDYAFTNYGNVFGSVHRMSVGFMF